MDICTFNNYYLRALLDNLSEQANKTIEDFNVDLLIFDASKHVSTFLDNLVSDLLELQIFLSTRMSNNSKILIDHISCNIPTPLDKTAMFGNVSSVKLDHLPQSFFPSDLFSNSYLTKHKIIPHDCKNFNKQPFLED